MNQESIFDEEDLVPEKVHWIYRVVGTLRILATSYYILSIFIYLKELYKIIRFESIENDNASTIIGSFFGLLLILYLISLSVYYSIIQLKFELRLDSEVFNLKNGIYHSIIVNILIISLVIFFRMIFPNVDFKYFYLLQFVFIVIYLPIVITDLFYLNKKERTQFISKK